MTVQFKENRKTYKVKRFPASAAMNIKVEFLWQPLELVALIAGSGTGAAPWVPPCLAVSLWAHWSCWGGGHRLVGHGCQHRYQLGACWCQWDAQLATPGAVGLAAWRWCWLGGTGSGAAQPCLHPPAPACTLTLSVCTCSPTHPPLPAPWCCLYSHAAYTGPPTLIPCLLLPTGHPSQRVPSSLPGIPLPRTTGQGTEMGIWRQPDTSPLLCRLGWLEGVWGQWGP